MQKHTNINARPRVNHTTAIKDSNIGDVRAGRPSRRIKETWNINRTRHKSKNKNQNIQGEQVYPRQASLTCAGHVDDQEIEEKKTFDDARSIITNNHSFSWQAGTSERSSPCPP